MSENGDVVVLAPPLSALGSSGVEPVIFMVDAPTLDAAPVAPLDSSEPPAFIEMTASNVEPVSEAPEVVVIDSAQAEKEKKMLEERLKVMEELLMTETAYVNDLKKLFVRYIEPVTKDPDILPKEEQAIIFSNVRTIMDLHDTLLVDMREAMAECAKNGSQKLTATFLKIVDFLRIYSVYCANRTHAISAAERCRKKYSKFDKLMTEGEQCGESLDSFLIKPVQRLCRYPLLFTVMVQKTPQSHLEYGALAKTLERLQQVANDVNEFSRKKDSANKIFSLSERLMGLEESLSSPGRILELDYESLHVSAPFTADKREPMFVALFSDFLLFAKPKKKKLLFKHKVLLATVAWSEPPAIGDSDWPVTIFDACNAMGIEITIHADTKAEREHFVKALEALSKAERERAATNPPAASAAPAAVTIPVTVGAVSNSPLKQSGALAKLMGLATGRGRSRSNSAGASDMIGANPAASEPILGTNSRENALGGLKSSSETVEEEPRHALTDLGISSRRRGTSDENNPKPSLKRTNSLLIGSSAPSSGDSKDSSVDRWTNALAASGSQSMSSKPSQSRPLVAPINSSKASRRRSLPREMNLIPETARETAAEEDSTDIPQSTARVNPSTSGSGHARKKSSAGVDEDFFKTMLMDKLNPYVSGGDKDTTKLTREERKKNRLSQSIGSSASEDPSPSATRDASLSSYDSESDVVGNNAGDKPIEALQGEEIRRLRRENRKLRERLQQAESTIWTMSEALRNIETSMKTTKALWNFSQTD